MQDDFACREEGSMVIRAVWLGTTKNSGKHLCQHFYEGGHKGIDDITVKVIDETNLNDPKNRETVWTNKLNSLVPNGWNLRE